MLPKKDDRRSNPVLDIWSRRELVKVCNRGDPVCLTIEINKRCDGGCLYCYASSTSAENLSIENFSLDTFKEILKVRKLGIQFIYLYGGDQLLHPKIKDIVFHGIQEGFHMAMPLAGLIPKAKAKWLSEAFQLASSKNQGFFLGIHIDSLDQEIYDQVNSIPGSLEMKKQGFQNLLDAGFPAEYTYGCPTFTIQTAKTMIELMDWFYSKGTKHVAMIPFKPLGLSKKGGEKWEPTLTQLKEFIYHRSEIEGKHILMVGTADGKYACQSHVAINSEGNVLPCLLFPDIPAGNIYKEDIIKIIKNNKKTLLLKQQIKGPCASCVSKHVCIGCRASAHLYLGDITASDPKCPFNPKAPEKVF